MNGAVLEQKSKPKLVPVYAPPKSPWAEVVMMTPERARLLLKKNHSNREIRPYHVTRIKRMIYGGRWRFNGQTIKLDWDGNLLDGQHRLQAIVECEIAVPLIVVSGIDKEAFATIDTVQLTRGAGDVMYLCGVKKYAGLVGTAVQWLIRYDRGVIPTLRASDNKVENDDIQSVFEVNRGIEDAVARCMDVRKIGSPSMLGFIYYALKRANQEPLAERMVETLYDCTRAHVSDPFFQLRKWLTNEKNPKSDPVHVLAIMFKACNVAYRGQKIHVLTWRKESQRPEPFPILEAVETSESK